MANPRQRRKARSSSHRPVSHSQKAKRNLKKTLPIRGPKALRDAWDKGKTVRQNYASLGLTHTLNPISSGGVEPYQKTHPEGLSAMAEREVEQHRLPQSLGKILRDETGKIVGVEVDDNVQTPEKETIRGSDHGLFEPALDLNTLSRWSAGTGRSEPGNHEKSSSTVIHTLEQISTPQTASNTLSFSLSGVGSRHPSIGELAFLQRLVHKYHDNVEQMARDRQLNPEQRTAAQLRRSLNKAGLHS